MKLLNYCIPGKPKRIAWTNLETVNKYVCRNLVWEGYLKGFFNKWLSLESMEGLEGKLLLFKYFNFSLSLLNEIFAWCLYVNVAKNN